MKWSSAWWIVIGAMLLFFGYMRLYPVQILVKDYYSLHYTRKGLLYIALGGIILVGNSIILLLEKKS